MLPGNQLIDLAEKLFWIKSKGSFYKENYGPYGWVQQLESHYSFTRRNEKGFSVFSSSYQVLSFWWRQSLWRQTLTFASQKILNFLVNNLCLYDYDTPDRVSGDGQSAVDRDTSKFVAL